MCICSVNSKVELESLLTPLSITFLNPKIFSFPSMRARLKAYLGSEMRKIKLQQIVGLYMNGTVIKKF